MNIRKILATGTALISLSGLVFAQDAPPQTPAPMPMQSKPAMRQGRFAQMQQRQQTGMARAAILKKLNLTDEQKTKLHDLRFQFQKANIEQQAQIKTARLELRQLTTAQTPDRKAIESKMNQLAQLRVQAAMAKFDHKQTVKNVFTPDQLKILKQFRENHPFAGKARGARHQMGNGMGAGMRGNSPAGNSGY